MADIEDFHAFTGIFDRIDDSIITDSQTVKIGVTKFPVSERPGVGFKGNEPWEYFVVKSRGEFLELTLGAGCYFYRILTQFLRPFLRFPMKERSFLHFSELLFTAIARSITSSLKEWSFIIVNKKVFCSCFGRALKAVKNTSAVACFVVKLASPYVYFNKVYHTKTVL